MGARAPKKRRGRPYSHGSGTRGCRGCSETRPSAQPALQYQTPSRFREARSRLAWQRAQEPEPWIGRRSTVSSFCTGAKVSLQRVSGNPAAQDRPAALEARALSRRFGPLAALHELDLRIEAGEGFALLGANGAGKTTFLRLAAGLLLPSSGELRVAGCCPAREPERVRRVLGFAMETSRLYPALRVERFLRFAAGARGMCRAAARSAAERVIEQTGLAAVAARPIGHCSRGYQQRVALAQALIGEPAVLLVDEPSAGLDPAQREEIWELLAGLRGPRTLVISTHDLEEARRLATRAAVLSAGRLRAQGAVSELLREPGALALFRDGARA